MANNNPGCTCVADQAYAPAQPNKPCRIDCLNQLRIGHAFSLNINPVASRHLERAPKHDCNR